MRLRQPTRLLLLRLHADDGVALVLALTLMSVLSIVVTGALAYSTQNQGSAHRSKADQIAFALAEAGLNNAVATLGNPSVNALSGTALPDAASPATAQYEGGTAHWWGQLDSATQTWSLVGRGIVRNPTGPGDVVRTTSEQIDVLADLTQPLNNQAWNYLMATRTGDGDGCDEELRQSVTISAPMYIYGNLCLYNTASIMPVTGPPNPPPAVNLVVNGSVSFNQPQTTIGKSNQKIASAYIAGGCNGHSPCRPNGGGDPVWANVTGQTPPAPASKPTADWDSWYANASPGPRHPCTQVSGTGGPVFDNNGTRDPPNGSVPLWNMTPPSTDYTCRVASGGGAVIGELSWNHTSKVLTVRGVIYIDGSIEVSESPVNYQGSASLYISGWFQERNGAQLCGGVSGGTCDFGAWNPNTELLLIMAAGDNGSRASVTLNQSSRFQGGLYAANDIVVGQSATFEGPMMGGSLVFNNSVTAQPFPLINTVPLGTPGNPNVYAKPQTPRNFTG
jgi:hypothetical protein